MMILAEVVPMRAMTEWAFWVGIALILISIAGFLWREFTWPRSREKVDDIERESVGGRR